MKNIIISNSQNLDKIKSLFKKDGVEKIHVLADFDRTLTTAFVDAKKVPSLISVLRDRDYLTSDYPEKAHFLYNKYSKIGSDPDISNEEKKKAMYEWWKTHFDLLIESGLNKKHIEQVINSGKIKLRNGALEFLDFLYQHNIPLIIISSCGLGGDAIAMFLDKVGKKYDNIHIVSNSYEWDKNGMAIGVKKPIIHSANKYESEICSLPFFGEIKNRKNVLLLGDSLSDIDMVKGFDYNNLIKIGFLNDEIEENLKYYQENYDVVILNDSDMGFVNEFLKMVLN